MRLLKVVINGYKRFKTRQVLRLDGKLVALVGPNEAGKTSLLRALEHLVSPSRFERGNGSYEPSRGLELADEHEVIVGLFVLEDDDRQAIADIEGAEGVSKVWVGKTAGGQRVFRLAEDSRLLKSESSRILQRRVAEQAAQVLSGTGDDQADPTASLAKQVHDEASAAEPLTQQRAQYFIKACLPHANTGEGSKFKKLVKELTSLRDAWTAAHANEERIRKILEGRLPRVLAFAESDRDLRSSYVIVDKKGNRTTYFPDKKGALDNLAATAGLSLDALGRAVEARDSAGIEKWLHEADASVTGVLRRGWKHGDMSLKLRVDGNQLHVMVGPVGDWRVVTERSDGLRQFVALAAFIQQGGPRGNGAILLIDEAERHLHYDAQAGLVEMLQSQTFARQVVYSTHSAACLPEDLGTGIRAVQPLLPDSSSVIHNTIWRDGELGLLPLHLAMGAGTFAFSAVRRAAFVEGNSDCALLPTMLRECAGVEQVGFVVVPGLSQLAGARIPELRDEALRVAFIVDGDAAGVRRARLLRRRGIPEEAVLHLPKDHVIEDLVDDEVYAEAVNAVLEVHLGRKVSITANELGSVNRPKVLESICVDRFGIEAPGKSAVAAEVLRLSSERNSTLVRGGHRAAVAALHGAIHSYLSTHRTVHP